jgi:hypothetical protein
MSCTPPFINLKSALSEYWMIYRGPGFLAVVWFGSTPTSFPPLPSPTCFSFSVLLCVASPAYWGERGRAWSRIIRPQKSWALYKWFNTLSSSWRQVLPDWLWESAGSPNPEILAVREPPPPPTIAKDIHPSPPLLATLKFLEALER